MNPFKEPATALETSVVDWPKLATTPYDKHEVDPYTKLRIILMNGTEYESVWMGHHFQRHCANQDLRRELAMLRCIEQQQQKRIAALKPSDETLLETTIGYEMLAVDLTSALARREQTAPVRQALDFALLEDFDHLYRYTNLLENDRHRGQLSARELVGDFVEIMPGRPTISEHRFPPDNIRGAITAKAPLFTKLDTGIITAAEQQTMNYYMNIGAFYENEPGRRLYAEIAMIEEQHVSQYGSLKDAAATPLACLLMHEYTECYLYWSCMETESDRRIRALWEELFTQEIGHLHKAAQLLQTYENTDYQEILPQAEFPDALVLQPSKDYVRAALETVRLTSVRENYCDVAGMKPDADFFRWQQKVNHTVSTVPSHVAVRQRISDHGRDSRFQEGPHPIRALENREKDNTEVGRSIREAQEARGG